MSSHDIINRHKNLTAAINVCKKEHGYGGCDASGLMIAVQFGGDVTTKDFAVEIASNTRLVLSELIMAMQQTQMLQEAMMKRDRMLLSDYLDSLPNRKESGGENE
jgi:hypothetical protein